MFRVAHVAAACERLPIVMAQLVVVPSDIVAADEELLVDRCVAVGADIFRVEKNADVARLRDRLKDAANIALIRSMRQSPT